MKSMIYILLLVPSCMMAMSQAHNPFLTNDYGEKSGANFYCKNLGSSLTSFGFVYSLLKRGLRSAISTDRVME